MNVLQVIVFSLCLLCNSSLSNEPASAVNPKDDKDFCEVMATPESFRGSPITLQASAHVLYGGILLKSSQCKVQDVSVHFMHGYEKESNATALETINRLQSKAREAALRGASVKAGQTVVSVILEGRLEKNPHYHVKIARGEQTLMAWDYNYQYAFVVRRVVSVRFIEQPED